VRALPFIVAIAAGACSSPRYYAVAHQQSQDVPEFRDGEPPNDQAMRELARGTTVAFFPPDACLDRRSAPTGTERDERVLRLQCGTVMTDLEKAAIAAGFEVVSWQSLRGSGQPIEYAKQKNVDLLFEINELDTVDVRDRDDQQQLIFFEHRGRGDDAPIAVGPGVAERCRRATADPTMSIVGLSASMDVKMVGVSTGRVLWSYRNTRGKDVARAAGVRYYPAEKPRRTWAWVALAIGGAVLLASTQGQPDAAAPGAVIAGIGVLGLVLRSHESPEEVLCNRPPVSDPFAPPMIEAPPGPETVSDRYDFSSQRRNRDPLAELRLALVREIVGDFTAQLRRARPSAR
jgi:hypothetical protein